MSGTVTPGQPTAPSSPQMPPPAVAPPPAQPAQAMPGNLAMFGQAANQPVTPGGNYLATILQALHGAHQQQMAAQQAIPNPQTYQPPAVSIQTPQVATLPTPGPPPPMSPAEFWQAALNAMFR